MQVREIMSAAASTVSPSATLEEVAVKMRDLDVGFLPVCDGERLLGTVTDRDIVIRALARKLDVARHTAADVMTSDVVVIRADERVEEAARKMGAAQVRRLVVVDDDDRLVGILSLGDLSRRASAPEMPAKTLEAVSEDRASPV